MPMNRIQFQPGLSLSAFMERYGTEARCEALLERLRWLQGFRCPRCGASGSLVFPARRAAVVAVYGVPASSEFARRHAP